MRADCKSRWSILAVFFGLEWSAPGKMSEGSGP